MALNETAPDSARDALLDRVYAAAPREEPPAALDEAIRAAARREVGSRPRSLRAALRTWRIPVSLAAVVVLSVSVVVLMKEEGALRLEERASHIQGMVVEAPPAPAASPAPLETPKKDAARLKREPVPTLESSTREEPEKRSAPAPGTVQEQAATGLAKKVQPAPETRAEPQPAAPSAQPPARTDGQARAFSDLPAAKPAPQRDVPAQRAEADTAARASEDRVARAAAEANARREAAPAPPPASAMRTAPGPAQASREPVWAGFERQPAERWIERIEALRRAGQVPEAREMLEEFRKRFPDYPVPASLAP
jgi:hypothetical protein